MKKAFAPPSEFEEYRLVQFLGHGEMGQVYLAYDTLLARHVAVKFVSTSDPGEAARQRFLTEARAAARLSHPNVVAVYRVGELDGRPYLVSEFVRGQTLDRAEKPIPWARVLGIAIELARGLAGAHRKGVLHRDVKPANAILAEDGTAKLLDFGLAKLVEARDGRDETLRGGTRGSTLREVLTPLTDPTSRAERPEGADPAATLDSATLAGGLPVDRGSLPDEPAPVGGSAAATIDPNDLPRASRWRTANRTGQGSMSDTAASLDSRGGASLTRIGAVMGTPDYMSPEVWRGEAGGRQADVYSFGATLYELCAGAPPHGTIPMRELRHAVESAECRPLLDAAPTVDPRFAAIIDKCLRRSQEERYPSGEELREALEQLQRATSGEGIPEGNPYRGLRPFESEHRALFFGRGAEIGVLVDRLRSEPFVVVTGESGVGKSSVCRAGVLPAINAGALEGGRSWTVVSLFPGRHPVNALSIALAPVARVDERTLSKQIVENPQAVVSLLRRALGDRAGLVLFVDQLEELTTVGDPAEAAAADDLLARLSANLPGVRLLVTARVDLLTKLARLPGLGEDISRALYILRPLTPERIHEVIVGPAEATGIRFESQHLIDTLVLTTANASGGLPLLQFALAELWEARDLETGIITERALESIGGVSGALSRHADGVLRALLPEQRRVARRILMKLVTIEGTRARRPEAELTDNEPHARAALDGLLRGRLLVVEESDETEGSVYEFAHEVLIHDWGTLREYLHEDAERRIVSERLRQAAAEWERLGHTPDVLWQKPQLLELARLGEGATANLGERDRTFLDRSRRALRRRRVFQISAAIGIPVLIGVVYLAVGLQAKLEIDEKVDRHVRNARISLQKARDDDERLSALRRRAFEKFDSRDVEAGEAIWLRARALEAEVEGGLSAAARDLESALALDAQNHEVRSRFGDVILERALLADRAHRPREREELELRLSLYDADGSRRARWSAPAKLRLRAAPGTRLALGRYTADARGRLTLETPRPLDLSRGPLSLTPGSYRIDATAEGSASVSYPVLLVRGESFELNIELPPESSVPRGFVYVPPGRFLFGSAADDSIVRGFYYTVPMHVVRSEGFLIGASEVTLADWLGFLAALDPAERARRRPGVAASVVYGGATLQLEHADGVWRFIYQPGKTRYVALAGGPLRYASRSRRQEQDWRRFPVTAIDVADARAYVAWLSRTGRLPGARLCSEFEWEYASRGADGREFPHGDELVGDDANFDETYGKDPGGMGLDEVGSHPASRSPFGLDDTSGNAFEWVVSSLKPDQYVGRGGSYFYERNTNRLANRTMPTPDLRDLNLGLRVCAPPPRLSSHR